MRLDKTKEIGIPGTTTFEGKFLAVEGIGIEQPDLSRVLARQHQANIHSSTKIINVEVAAGIRQTVGKW